MDPNRVGRRQILVCAGAGALALGRKVLAGAAPLPDRAEVDEFFAVEATLRALIQHPLP